MQRFVHVVAAVIPRGHCGSSHALCPTTAVRANRHAQELVAVQPSSNWSNEVVSAVLTASCPTTSSRRGVSTLDKHPTLAACFMGAATSKFLDASTINTNSRRLAWWRCPSCSHEHRSEVRTFAASSGQCPSCGTKPSRSRSPSPQLTSKRCISTSSSSLNATREGQIKTHITEVPAFGTTEWRKLLQPMLAKSYDKVGKQIKWGSEKVMVSPKIDGVRCLVVCDAPRGSSVEEVAARTYFVTRSGILLDSCDHIRPQLAPLLQSCPGLVLDGEVYASSLLNRMGGDGAPIQSFDELVGVVRRGKEFASESILAKQQALEFHIFDATGTYSPVHNTPFTERYAFLAANVPTGLLSVRLVPALPVDSHAHALEMTSGFVANGYEGSMVRRGGLCRYAHGARSANLLKVKTFEDAEFAVVGALEGRGKWQGMLGAFVCKTPTGSEFTVSPQTDEKQRRAMWQTPNAYVGSALTVQYQGLSPSGIPRFPVGKAIRGSMLDRSDWI